MPYEPRLYRRQTCRPGLRYFQAAFLETDLWIGVDEASYQPDLSAAVRQRIFVLRQELDHYIQQQPLFETTFRPLPLLPGAPPIACRMAEAARVAEVGPMAAVAGAFADEIGNELLQHFGVNEVLVENGGDIFLSTASETIVGIYAGASPLSGKVSLRIKPQQMPLGVCTSAATVGPSVSLGRTDATVTLARTAALADAYASTLGNRVKTVVDLQPTLDLAPKLPGLFGCLIILGDRLAAWGELELC